MIPPLTEIHIIGVTKALDCKAGSLSPRATIVMSAQGKYTGMIGFLGKLPGRHMLMGNTYQRKGRENV